MDYRMMDEIETDYGTFSVTDSMVLPSGGKMLTLGYPAWPDRIFTLVLDSKGYPYPDSEQGFMRDVAYTYEERGLVPLADPDKEGV